MANWSSLKKFNMLILFVKYAVTVQSIESTKEIGKNIYFIYTLSTQMKGYVVKYRYTLKFIKQEWRIDKKEIFDIFKDKWVSQIF